MIRELAVNLEKEKTEANITTEDAKLYLEHIRMGMGNAFVMAREIIRGIKDGKFTWDDIGVTPEILAETIDIFASIVFTNIRKNARKIKADHLEIKEFLSGVS
jgi:hypothetical protein